MFITMLIQCMFITCHIHSVTLQVINMGIVEGSETGGACERSVSDTISVRRSSLFLWHPISAPFPLN